MNFGYLMADVKPNMLFVILYWQLLLPRFTVVDLIAKIKR